MRIRTGVLIVAALACGASAAAVSAARTSQQVDALRATEAPPNAIWLDSLDLTRMVQRRQTPRAGRTLAGGRGRGGNAAGSPITLGGVVYPHGIGTLSINELIVDLKEQATRFVAMVGLDDAASRQGSVTVEVWVDNSNKFKSDVLKTGDAPVLVDVDLTGARSMELFIDDGGDVSTGDNAAELQKPFLVMRDALRKTNRDIVYSLCQYGMGNVWEWGADVGGNYWRTTGDLTDVWSNMSAVGFRQANREQWSKPGHWTDPDMLVIGKVGWGPNIHDTRLTPNEQLTHIALWVLQAAPLLIGADMSQFDKFTTDLMTNHEVMEVSQDVLGRGAARVYQRERLELWARPLADGTIAAGLFNRGLQSAAMTMTWEELGVKGSQPVRDLWQQKDLGSQTEAFTTTVPAHGVVMVKIGKGQS